MPDHRENPDTPPQSEQRLDPRSIVAARLAGAIFCTVLCGVLLLAALAAGLLGTAGAFFALALLGAWVLFTGALATLVLCWPAVRYRHTSYVLSSGGIRIRRGVLWRSVCSIPRSRVQHTDVGQGPIERAFGLATLVIYTAGTHHAAVPLGGLARETALSIRDHLLGGGGDDAV